MRETQIQDITGLSLQELCEQRRFYALEVVRKACEVVAIEREMLKAWHGRTAAEKNVKRPVTHKLLRTHEKSLQELVGDLEEYADEEASLLFATATRLLHEKWLTP